MRQITKAGLAAFAGGVALASAPAVSHAGVMSIADKASVGVDSQTTQVDWRPYVHRHHRWHPGWRWGYGPGARHWGYAPRWGYSRWGYAPTVWGSAAPYCNYGAWGYSPAAGALGVAADVAAAPLWAAGALTSPVWW